MLIISLISFDVQAQKKLIKKLLSVDKDSTRNASFLPVPVVSYSQETGLELGVGTIYSFYFDKKDLNNRSTNIYSNLSYSTKGIYNLMLKGDAWTAKNQTHIIGELRFKKNPFDFFGIGNNTFERDKDRLIQNFFKLNFEIERQILSKLYIGTIITAEHQHFKDNIETGIFHLNQFNGKSGGFVGQVGLSQSYDTRNSNNYTTEGFFSKITLQYAPSLDKKLSFKGWQTKINLRGFVSVSDHIVIGAQGLYSNISGKNVPFFMLPQLGNDEMMRGYYTGRYRDHNLVAIQTEIRYRYNPRFGAVIFGGGGMVYGHQKASMASLKPNYGGGLRYFFDPEKGLSLRLDYGIGDKKAGEKRQTGFYIGLSEAF